MTLYSIVYQLVNETKRMNNERPFLYIGYKAECEVCASTIIDRRGKEYWSSSKSVKQSLKDGDFWKLDSYYICDNPEESLRLESELHDFMNVVNNSDYYNKSNSSMKFNSMLEGVGDSISKAKLGVSMPCHFNRDFYDRLHTSEAIYKSKIARLNNENVKRAAKERNARWSADDEFMKRRRELTRKTFKGRKTPDHVVELRRNDPRFISNRLFTDEQIYDIRFGKHKDKTLKELVEIYDITKPSLCRLRNFKVFKYMTEEWFNENEDV